MSQPFRLARGGRIDRARPVTFTFNGRTIDAYAGDTVASALLANGVHLVGRSFKYHRPRGILAAGSEEPNALLDVDRGGGRREPNARATMVEAIDGLTTTSQNHWPSLERDIGALNDRLGSALGAGFYYKTFMWPPKGWAKLYEPLIRRAAGLGRAPADADPECYQHRHAHCEVLVVGMGPAGIAAAEAAAAGGGRVIVCDEQAEPGGSLLHETTATIDGVAAQDWLAAALARLAARPNVTVLPRTTAFGYFNHNHIALSERLTDHLAAPPPNVPRERLWQVRAGHVVLATGAHERPLVFADNDRPGIMLAEAIRCMVGRYGVVSGRRIVFACNGASAYQAAIDARRVGADVVLVDERPADATGGERAAAHAAGVVVMNGYAAVGSRGRRRVSALRIARLEPDGSLGAIADARWLACDCVGLSGGWTPAVHLFSQARGKLAFDAALDAFVPGEGAEAASSVGSARGDYDLRACLNGGAAAGARAAGVASALPVIAASASFAGFVRRPAVASTGNPAREKAFVDFQNDVTAKDIALAVREGFESVEHVKRYTTTGMATDQGKTSNMAALSLIGQALGRPASAVGTTTYRLPYTPVTFGAFAGQSRGDLFDPVRTTPLHARSQLLGARFEDVGQWKRAWYYPREGEDMAAAVARETRAVRRAVGLFDASTLGKIEVVGRDAGAFLDLMYTSRMSALAVGHCRYGLMLKEDGYIFDDGIVARLAEDRFHVTTTTGGAARVLAHMEDYLQTEFTHLEVFLTSTTEQWAVLAVQGPRAAAVLAPLVEGLDCDLSAFPAMRCVSCQLAGVEARLVSASFTGEAGFEINVPSDFAGHVWDAVMAQGGGHGLTVYGTEAMHVLRAERGFIIVGQETDGTVTADDLGLGRMVNASKADFIGKRSLQRVDLTAAGRKQLVGLECVEPGLLLDEGAQLVETPDQPVPMRMIGHVTSSYRSANTGTTIALALLADGRARIGSEVYATIADMKNNGGFARVRVRPPVFWPPTGEADI